MSHLDDRFSTSVATVWRSTEDQYGQETWYRVGTFNCTRTQITANAVDNFGKTYTPAAVYYSSSTSIVQYDDIIAIGDITGSDPISLGYRDRVRTIKEAETGYFGWSNSMQVMVE